MDSSKAWLPRLGSALGRPGPLRPLGAGTWRVRAGGRELVAKVGAGVGDEAAGLGQLGAVPGGPAVPEVVLLDGDLLVTEWVEQARRSPPQEEILGGKLAALHSAPWPAWGGGSSWIGACPVDAAQAAGPVEFYGRRLRDLAGRCGLEAAVEPVVARLGELLAPRPPSLVHGDLWWGNVLWDADGRPWLIDPSTHGGHPEEDLAMLGLFGEVPVRLLGAYRAVRALDDGWQDRVELFRLYPLLVHTVLFGGGYRSQAEAAARAYR